MIPLLASSFSVLFALGLAVLMIATAVFIVFYHDRKHMELDQWVDFSYSRDTMRHVLMYYRFMGISMAVFYVLFVASCLMLQNDGYQLFADATGPVHGGFFGTAMYALDLVLRGGFFDVMEHFDLHLTRLHINHGQLLFLWYSFVFRMYFGLVLIKVAFSFVWIWTKISRVRKAQAELQKSFNPAE